MIQMCFPITIVISVTAGGQSRQSYLLESVPARRRRLAQQDTSGTKKRGNTGHPRINKSLGPPKTQIRAGDVYGRAKKVLMSSKEKENEGMKNQEEAPATSDRKSIVLPPASTKVEEHKDELVSDTKPKRKLENTREVKVRAKKVKAVTNPPVPVGDINDSNNNSSEVKPVVGVSISAGTCWRRVYSLYIFHLLAIPRFELPHLIVFPSLIFILLLHLLLQLY